MPGMNTRRGDPVPNGPRGSAIVAAACAASFAIGARAMAHEEILIARLADGRLVGDVGAPQPVALDPSVFPGIPGFATGLLGFESATIDEPDEGFFMLDAGASIEAVVTGLDPGARIYDGLRILSVGDRMAFGPPLFDYHPVFCVTTGSPGATFTLRFVLHDVNGIHADSAEFSVALTPAAVHPCAADLNGDGAVNSGDLALLLGSWAMPGFADFDASGAVGSADLALLLGAWGTCP